MMEHVDAKNPVDTRGSEWDGGSVAAHEMKGRLWIARSREHLPRKVQPHQQRARACELAQPMASATSDFHSDGSGLLINESMKNRARPLIAAMRITTVICRCDCVVVNGVHGCEMLPGEGD